MRYITVLLSTLCVAASVQAGPYAENLQRCLANATSGKDRADLARAMFVGMAQYQDIGNIASIPPEKRDAAYRDAGHVYNHLLTVACSKEIQDVVRFEGGDIKPAFAFLGGLAMRELMTNPNVAAAFEAPAKYIDREKLQRILLTK